MDMLTIWGRASSSNVMKVLWLCEELGIDYNRIDAGGAFGRTRDADYLAMNPNAKVPTIEEPDGFTLWESNAILRYLAATRPGGGALWPEAPRERALIDRWMDWQLGTLNLPITVIFFTYVRTAEADRDYPATEKARVEAAAVCGILERQLEGREYLAGDFSIADVAMGIHVHRWFALPVERPAMPNLEAYYARLGERHAGYRRHVMVPMV